MKKQLTKILSELNWGGYNIQPGTVVTYKDFPAFKTESQVKESEDHEVSMAQSSLDAIIKYANHLKSKLGTTEKDIPAWIQDHIAKAENYIQQSANNYHEYTTSNTIGESKYESVNESTEPSDIIKDLDTVKNDLIKKADVLIAKKKKLYANVDIESPMSADEKKLNKDIADLFSQIQQLILQKRKIK